MILLTLGPDGKQSEVPLRRGLVTIGRDADCDVRLDDDEASRRHAELCRVGDQWLIVDTGSTNGTQVDGTFLRPGEAVAVQPGQPILIGSTRLILRAERAASAEPDGGPDTLQGAVPPLALPGQERWAGETGTDGTTPAASLLCWAGRLFVAAGAFLLILSPRNDWLNVRVQLPLVGTAFDRSYTGLDTGYGWLLLAAAVISVLLMLLDVATVKGGMAAGLGQFLVAVFAALALATAGYSFYRAGSQAIFGVSLLDVFTRYARNVVTLSIQNGVYFAAAGLGGLLLGGLLRLIAATTRHHV